MPPTNSIKEYEVNAYYHLYNRGVEKRQIFLDDQDYQVFLSYLKTYLSPPDDKRKYEAKRLKNFSKEIDLICYCLMSNHFHLLIKQHTLLAMTQFMLCLGTKYSMYFNKKYQRVGRLFQGVYKGVKVTSEEQLLYLTKYIHRNPHKDGLQDNKYISLKNYLGKIDSAWVKKVKILQYFSETNPDLSYSSFLEMESDLSCIDKLTID